jgi:maltose O-acetyltransferase
MDSCGKNFQVSSSVIFNSLSGLNVGENVYMAYQSVFIVKSLVVEDNVIFGPNCLVSGGNHQFDGSSFRDLPSISEKVIIKEGSWIAGNCTILSGTIFPAKSILAAGAVLTKSHVKEHSVYGGIPAKFLKNHFQN